jgi:hypothetical protein
MNNKEKRKNPGWSWRMIELFAMIKEFIFDSDRSAIMVGASRIDIYLERILKLLLKEPSNPKEDSLFNIERPLSSFSSKIDLAHRIGILTDQLAINIHLVRKLRNDAAHDAYPFDLQKMKDRNILDKLLKNYEIYKDTMEDLQPIMLPDYAKSGDPCRVRLIIIMILMRLEDVMHEIAQTKQPRYVQDLKLLPLDVWRNDKNALEWKS